MKTKILLSLGLIFLLSGCSLDSMLKRSASNKLIDTKGFHGSKRRPLYNRKYIDRAKINISQNEYDEEEEDEEDDYASENVSPSVRNRYMYQDMIEADMDAKRAKKSKKRRSYSARMNSNDRYPDIHYARDLANDSNGESDIELKKELSEIKSMLSSARKDLTKYRCPVEKAKEQSQKAPVHNKKLHEQVRSEHESLPTANIEKAPHKKVGPTHFESSKPEQVSSTQQTHIELPRQSQPYPQPIKEAQHAYAPAHVYADEPSSVAREEATPQYQLPIESQPTPQAQPLEPAHQPAPVAATPAPLAQAPVHHVDQNAVPALPQFPPNSRLGSGPTNPQ